MEIWLKKHEWHLPVTHMMLSTPRFKCNFSKAVRLVCAVCQCDLGKGGKMKSLQPPNITFKGMLKIGKAFSFLKLSWKLSIWRQTFQCFQSFNKDQLKTNQLPGTVLGSCFKKGKGHSYISWKNHTTEICPLNGDPRCYLKRKSVY